MASEEPSREKIVIRPEDLPPSPNAEKSSDTRSTDPQDLDDCQSEGDQSGQCSQAPEQTFVQAKGSSVVVLLLAGILAALLTAGVAIPLVYVVHLVGLHWPSARTLVRNVCCGILFFGVFPGALRLATELMETLFPTKPETTLLHDNAIDNGGRQTGQ